MRDPIGDRQDFFRRPTLVSGFCIVLLVLVQVLHTLVFLPRLTLEDAAESLRSPYWWAVGRTVYNGVSSNIGYYAALAAAYRVFGYSIYLAKWLRLALHCASLLSLFVLLRRWMGERLAIVPLLVIGLSPTWLFLNTNQAAFGFDLQCAPLLLLAAISFPTDRNAWTRILWVAFGLSFTYAALIYPSMLFHLPSLALLVLWRWTDGGGSYSWVKVAEFGTASFFGACLIVVAGILYVKDPQLLIYDPVFHRGIFRGGGEGITFNPNIIADNSKFVFYDFFVSPKSYLFDIPQVEFQSWMARISFVFVIFGGMFVFIRRERDHLLVWLLFSLVSLFLLPQFVQGMPGIRRSAGALFAYYGLLAYLWKAAFTWPAEKMPTWFRRMIFAGVLLQLLALVVTLGQNLNEGQELAKQKNFFFFQQDGDPELALAYWDKLTRDGGFLQCGKFNFSQCRYAEIYGAIQGYRYWSGLPRMPIRAWDPIDESIKFVDFSLWEKQAWPY